MIRFLPIEAKHELCSESPCFAFFNTTTGRFIELAGDHVFESIEDLKEAFLVEYGPDTEMALLRRLLGFTETSK